MMKKLTPQSLTDRFAQDLCEAIVRGDLQPGVSISSEAELADEYGISRIVVREGIRQLVALGMIDKRQGRRSKIASKENWDLLNPDLLAIFMVYADEKHKILDELFTVRMLVESQAAADAALYRSEIDLEIMREQIAEMEQNIADPEAFILLDMSFHNTVSNASKNLIVAAILNLLTNLLVVSRYYTTQESPALKDALEQHRGTFAAIQAQNPAAAKEAMWQHLVWSRQVVTFTAIQPNNSIEAA